jgi:hypothetical protein
VGDKKSNEHYSYQRIEPKEYVCELSRARMHAKPRCRGRVCGGRMELGHGLVRLLAGRHVFASAAADPNAPHGLGTRPFPRGDGIASRGKPALTAQPCHLTSRSLSLSLSVSNPSRCIIPSLAPLHSTTNRTGRTR